MEGVNVGVNRAIGLIEQMVSLWGLIVCQADAVSVYLMWD